MIFFLLQTLGVRQYSRQIWKKFPRMVQITETTVSSQTRQKRIRSKFFFFIFYFYTDLLLSPWTLKYHSPFFSGTWINSKNKSNLVNILLRFKHPKERFKMLRILFTYSILDVTLWTIALAVKNIPGNWQNNRHRSISFRVIEFSL